MKQTGGARPAVLLVTLILWPAIATGQDARPVDLGIEVTTVQLSEFDLTDTGVGGRATWWFAPTVAIDAGLSWFHGSTDSVDPLIRQARLLGVVGVKTVASWRRVEFSGQARPGFLRFAKQDHVVCIAVSSFPTPLPCQVATGYTGLVVDFSAGASITLNGSGRARLSIEIGDLVVRYGLDAYRSNGEVTDGVLTQNFIVHVGFAWRL